MPFFSKVFKSKDGQSANAKRNAGYTAVDHEPPSKPRYASNWDSTEVVIEEVEELVRACTNEMKSRAEALDTPFLLLPFRPEGDVSSARTFIHNFFKANRVGAFEYRGESLRRELRLTEPDVLCAIIKWIWSRIPEGVVSWNVYASFRAGEQESGMVVNSFDAFIPLSVDEISRRNVIYDFFDLLSAIAAHGKVNGMGGRKLSRMAGWWAFEQSDTGKGFVGGYKSWADAADATSHLFFAYLRSRAPEAVNGIAGISNLPRSLQALVAQTEYPPQRPSAMQSSTAKVLMIVDAVSPTPFALLRRARLFDYRADDKALNKFAEYADPVDALTEECKRVLESISMTNQNSSAKSRRGADDSWSRFQDEGFSFVPVDSATQSPQAQSPISKRDSPPFVHPNMQARAQSRLAPGGRPTTPSWADFLNTGFVEDGKNGNSPTLLLRPDQQLPPVVDRSSMGSSLDDEDLEPGELASINRFELDESFWWVWMTSLAGEETSTRKAAFGRCALVETSISGGSWLLLEEQVKGASHAQSEGAYIAEKKSRFGFSRRSKSTKKKGMKKADEPETPRIGNEAAPIGSAKASMSPGQKAKISAAAAVIARQQKSAPTDQLGVRRGRFDDASSTKTSSMLTVGFTAEASPAMKWANAYDKEAVRKQYLGDNFAGKGLPRDLPDSTASGAARGVSPGPPSPQPPVVNIVPAEEEQITAPAEVSLPTASSEAAKSQQAVGRKAMTAESTQHVHPAFRPQAANEVTGSKKLQKKQPGSLKKMFVKRRDDSKRASTEVTGFSAPQDPADLVAHEEATESRARPAATAAAANAATTPAQAPASAPSAAVAAARAAAKPQPEPRKQQRSAVRDMVQNFETAKPAPPNPNRAAPAAPLKESPRAPETSDFSSDETPEENRFDQGPLDMPAFVPRGSFEAESVQSPAVSTFQDQGPSAFIRSQQALVDTISEVSEDEEEPIAPTVSHMDRWAQIRKNAAERAARASEEQSSRSQSQGRSTFTDRTTTDDGETSGEETMDERVARIKARVAHLTGNMNIERS
ncbi:hypothetical protein ANO11243_044670 [Dothideomycetidae sp. 11243]|nr:hypothetical protein ANO11243_044670 [fungal sp. No.11243]